MADYKTLLITLDQWGLRDVLIPFAIIFTLCFALLQRIGIFGKAKGGTGADKDKIISNKKINTILALAIAASTLIPHFTGRGFDVVIFINKFLPNSFLLLFVLLLFLALIGTVGGKTVAKESPLLTILAIVAVFSLVVILLQATNQISYPFLNFLNDPNTQAIAIVALVFVLVIWYISKEDPEAARKELLKKSPLLALKELGERMFGGR